MTRRAWRVLMVSAVLVGLGVRLASVLGRPHLTAGGDPGEYLGQANLLAAGKGWIEPITYAHTGVAAQTAKLPPLYTMMMALCSLAGFKSFLAHRVWSAVLATTGVALGGVVGRDLAGERAGVLAAFGLALYPEMWMPASIGMSETISPILVLAVLWAAYRMHRSPSGRRAAVLGLAIGFAGLARGELLVLAALVLLPLAYMSAPGWGRRLRLVLIGAAATAGVIAPWTAFNLSRFDHPVLVSDEFGVTFAAANCDASWHGTLAGYWSMPCALRSVAGVHGDESASDPVAVRAGLRYIGDHPGGLPAVVLERLGRTFGFWRVGQQTLLDTYIEGRPAPWVDVGLACYYALLPAAAAGVWLLRRAGTPVFPLLAVLGEVVLVTVAVLGQTRYRATLEPVLVLLAAVAVDAGLGRLRRPVGTAAYRPDDVPASTRKVSTAVRSQVS